MRHLHLNPTPDTADPVFAGAVAHAQALAETRDPVAAMRAAFSAAGVDRLDDRYDVLLGELDAMKARLDDAETTRRTPAPFDLSAAIDAALTRPVTRPSWAGPQREPAGRRAG